MTENMAAHADNPYTRPKQPGRPKIFNCPNCAGTVTVKALGHSIIAVCAYCSSVIDVANENLRVLTTAQQKTRPTLLAIGSKGRLLGILWEVIGYMEKTDETSYYRWDEYLLYNPYHGFRFLTQSRGHWSLFKVLKRSFTDTRFTNEIHLDGQKYELFLKGWAKVVYVKGEFYWRVKKDESTRVTDYISPPYLLSIDQNDDEINVAVGEYLKADAVAKAFNVAEKLPYRSGVAANQPGPFPKNHVSKIWLTTLMAFVLATVLQMVYAFSTKSTYLYSNTWEIAAIDKDKTISTDAFILPKRSNLLINSTSPLNNDWLELDITLVNEQDEEIQSVKQAIEFYSGNDYDGYWSEGSTKADTLFSAIPKGTYRLLIDADAGALQNGIPVNFSIAIKRNIANWSNYGFTLMLLLLYPCYVTLRHKYFENLRWSESDRPDNFWR
jgi:hypothetical protein